jgi:hypothetical protein
MKILSALILVLSLNLNLEAATITRIFVESFPGGYHLEVYGRLKDVSQCEKIDIKTQAELDKITGIASSPEFSLGKAPIRFKIWFADASNPDKVEGSISQVDFDLVTSDVFTPKSFQSPTLKASTDAVKDIKDLIATK